MSKNDPATVLFGDAGTPQTRPAPTPTTSTTDLAERLFGDSSRQDATSPAPPALSSEQRLANTLWPTADILKSTFDAHATDLYDHFGWTSEERAAAEADFVIDVNYFCRLATIILAGPRCGRGCDSPTAG